MKSHVPGQFTGDHPDSDHALRCIMDAAPEIRKRGADTVITGYAAVYDKPSVDFGGWSEIVRPGAFDRSIKDDDEVLGRLEHNNGINLLGRRSAGNLELWSDETGLGYAIDPPDTSVARDVVTLIRDGIINQSSFAFWPRPEGWEWTERTNQNGGYIRELTDVYLYDVAPVGEPAYPDSKVWTEERRRSIKMFRQSIHNHLRLRIRAKQLSCRLGDTSIH